MNANKFILIDNNINIEEVKFIDKAIINLVKSNKTKLEK